MCSLLLRIFMPLSLLVLGSCPLSSSPSATDAVMPEPATGAQATEALPNASSIHSAEKEVIPMLGASGVEPIRCPTIPSIILRKQILDVIGSPHLMDNSVGPNWVVA